MPRAEISQFRSTRQRTLARIAGLSEDEMAERPAVGKWSAGEVVDHLLRAERLWRREVEELVHLARSGRQPFLNRLVTDFPMPVVGRLPAPLLGLFSIPLTLFTSFVPLSVFLTLLGWRQIPAQAPASLAPRPGHSADELRQALQDEAAVTAAVFADNGDLNFHRLLYQHPLLGIVNAVDLLRVITAHEQRHQEQLSEVLATLGIRGKP